MSEFLFAPPALRFALFYYSVEVLDPLAPERKPRKGTGILFHESSTDRFMFFRRDHTQNIPYPGRICPIGGGRRQYTTPEEKIVYEQPEATIRREVPAELFYLDTDQPFELGEIEHIAKVIDDRPGEIDVFACELEVIPALTIKEGDGLVFLSREETLATDFPYGYNECIYWYVTTH